jgi:dinuclear metal center YbgI/SA1388 family protein
MHTLIDLSNQLNEFLQISLFSDVCPNGIQVEGNEKINQAATAVSCSLNVIKEAAARNADLLIVHHGIFWNRDSPVISGVKKEKLKILLSSGISLVAYHLPLDAHREVGNNWKAALDLGWSALEPFFAINGQFIGVKGRFKPLLVADFQSSLAVYYGQKAVVALGGKKTVQSAALISGGAYKQIADAAKCGVDCFVTGNFDEPAWHDAHEYGINFFSLGHASTEKVGPRALADYLTSVHCLKTSFIDEFNPF